MQLNLYQCKMVIMTDFSNHNRQLRIPIIVVMIGVAVAGLLEITDPSQRSLAAVFLASFAIILFNPFTWHKKKIWTHIGLTILSALVAALLSLSHGWNFFPILFFLLAPMAMMYLSIKEGVIWICIFIFITGTVLYLVNGPIGFALLIPYAAGYIFFGIFGRVTIEAEENRRHTEQLLVELQNTHRQLQAYADEMEELVVSRERNRIAREMHDTLGHRLTIASVQLEAAQRLIPTDPERAISIVETVRKQVKEGLTDLRRTVAMLRATVEEDMPLDKALTRLVEQVQSATSLVIHLSLDECPQNLSLPQRQALYRTAQEALTNIQRHAQASEAWLQLITRDDVIELIISDNGVGFSEEQTKSGFGLLGLKERAELQGGEFSIDRRSCGGTQVTLNLPLISQEQFKENRERIDE